MGEGFESASYRLLRIVNIEELRDYCLSKPQVTESFPFDETTLVFKVYGKMFALTDVKDEFSINLKCEPEKAIELREEFPCVHPGYHMNKQHWNTVYADGSVEDSKIREWVDDSYRLVVKSLSLKVRKEYFSDII